MNVLITPARIIGSPCKILGHGSVRYRCNNTCVACSRELNKTHKRKNYLKQWNKNHQESIKNYQKQWRKENRTNTKTRCNNLLNGAKKRSKKYNLDYDLTIEWLLPQLQQGKCSITNLPFDFTSLNGSQCHPYAPSIDRIDSNLGYTQKNCRIILWALNAAFSDWGEKVFLNIAKILVNSNLKDVQ